MGKIGVVLCFFVVFGAGGQDIVDDVAVVRTILEVNGLTNTEIEQISTRDENGRIVSLNLDNKELGAPGIKELPQEIGRLTMLRHLSLRHNVLTSIPSSIGNCTQLQTLDLGYNDIGALPAELKNLQNLTKLDLRYNELTEIPEAVCQLKSLWYLQLWGNRIEKLPSCITKMPALKELYLNNNRLTTLPEGLMQMKSLSYIDFRENYICNPSAALEKWMTQKEERWKYYMNCEQGPVKKR